MSQGFIENKRTINRKLMDLERSMVREGDNQRINFGFK